MIACGHIALFVSDLRQAEAFYQRVFGMRLLMREARLPDDEWYTLPADKGWDDAQAAGIELEMLALQRDAFVLALFTGKPVAQGTVLEIGISVPQAEVAAVRDRLPEEAVLVTHEHDDLMFRDPFGFLWHVWATGEAFRSNGETAGRWLAV